MSCKITPIPVKHGIVNVNCYLIELDDGYILIDTGLNKTKKQINKALDALGLEESGLNLIILTHGDFDHIGNCAYLKNKFCCQVAMNEDDENMATEGDMFFNRCKPPFILRIISNIMFPFKNEERFSPDIHIKEGDSFSEYGFNAKVVSIPGHSKGSVGILTDEGDLFCGDLLENTKKPQLATIIDNKEEARNSLKKLLDMDIDTVYPGHGKSFNIEELKENSLISS